MAATGGSNGGQGKGRERPSLLRALLQLGLVAVVLAGSVATVVHRGQVRKQVEQHLKEARAQARRDNPADLQKALAALEALFTLDADAADAQALAADVHTRLWLEHRRPEAEARAREHLARAEALESPSGERHGARALHLLADGKAVEAEKYLEELEAQGARSPKLWLARARAQQRRGHLLEARLTYARASEEAWREPRYPVAHAEALLDEGLYPQAAEALKKALGANPDHLQARLSLALARLYQGGTSELAARTVTGVQAREKELSPALQARLRVVRAALALAEGRVDEALTSAEEALAAAPDEHQALFVRARALAFRKDAGARAAFLDAVARQRTAPVLYLEGARALQHAEDGEGALALLDAYEAVFRDVRVADAEGRQVGALERDDRYWLVRGNVLEALGRPDEALQSYDNALAVKGVGMARAQYAKGALLLARQDYAAARALLVEVAPEDGRGTLAEAYEAMGDLFFAQEEFAAGCQHYFFGLSRALGQGVPRAALQERAEAVGRRLTTARQSNMARIWKQETEALLR
jgi:tetratricopeptide (TPR) repeat protein